MWTVWGSQGPMQTALVWSPVLLLVLSVITYCALDAHKASQENNSLADKVWDMLMLVLGQR